MTVAENLVLARGDVPAVIDWTAERAELDAFMETMPFRVPLDARRCRSWPPARSRSSRS